MNQCEILERAYKRVLDDLMASGVDAVSVDTTIDDYHHEVVLVVHLASGPVRRYAVPLVGDAERAARAASSARDAARERLARAEIGLARAKAETAEAILTAAAAEKEANRTFDRARDARREAKWCQNN